MEKFRNPKASRFFPDREGFALKKLFRMLRFTLFCFFLSLIQVMALDSYSQQTRLTLNEHDRRLEDVLKTIEDKTEFFFLYNRDLINVDQKVDVKVTNQTIKETMDALLKGTDIHYSVANRQIILSNLDNGSGSEIQQQKTVGGKVTDSSGAPLPGVSVVVKGTTTGVISDSDGNFKLINVQNNAILQFSFVGMKTQELSVSGKSTINVSLLEESVGLEEVVAVGYGSKRKKDLTGSISTVQAGEMEKINSLSPQFALQGNTTGVRIVNTSGDPNAAPKIYIRGVGTWQGSVQPLYVIDGQIITPPKDDNADVISAGNLDTPPNLWSLVNPNDIESMSVLKDASAAAIYGSRGANGVIIITTKRGKKGDATIELNAQHGVQNIPTYKMQNTQQYVDLVNEMYANNSNPDISIAKNLYGREETNDFARRIGYSPQFDPTSPYYISSKETYDWQKDLVRSNAIDNQYDLKLSGGTRLFMKLCLQ
jgi:TonB-linked SusC/RagA family outer membrane protein